MRGQTFWFCIFLLAIFPICTRAQDCPKSNPNCKVEKAPPPPPRQPAPEPRQTYTPPPPPPQQQAPQPRQTYTPPPPRQLPSQHSSRDRPTLLSLLLAPGVRLPPSQRRRLPRPALILQAPLQTAPLAPRPHRRRVGPRIHRAPTLRGIPRTHARQQAARMQEFDRMA
jgi:protein TonB